MTMEEIKKSAKAFLTPADVCEVIGCTAYTLTQAAKHFPEKLGFRETVVGTRIKIPREAFVRWVEGQ